MKRMHCTMLLLILAAGLGRGQELPRPTAHDEIRPAGVEPAATGPSPWIRYTHNRVECCGPLGGDGPIAMEIYFRTGPDLVLGGGRLADSLNTGWVWAAGGRSLFYNVEHTAAWTADLGISHTYNNAGRPDLFFVIPEDINIPPLPPFTIDVEANARTLNRTFANLSLGRERYRGNTAWEGARRWRTGWDVGTRLGSARLELNVDGFQSDYQRLGSFAYGFFGALHSDIEFSRGGCCIWFLGGRFEIGQTYTHFRNINSNEIWDVNLLGTVGVRY